MNRERQTPALIQKVFDARSAKAELEAQEAANKQELNIKKEKIMETTYVLLRVLLPDPLSMKVKQRKPLTSAQMAKSLEKMTINFRMGKDEDKDPYPWKLKFPVKSQEKTTEVVLSATSYPQNRNVNMRIDIDILPHTFDIRFKEDVSVSAVARKKKFHAQHPENIGSPGWMEPEYNREIELEEAGDLLDLLTFINKSNIRHKNLTPRKVMLDETRIMQASRK